MLNLKGAIVAVNKGRRHLPLGFNITKHNNTHVQTRPKKNNKKSDPSQNKQGCPIKQIQEFTPEPKSLLLRGGGH